MVGLATSILLQKVEEDNPMARKDGVDIGSMELFTDPICNIFGLFCFLVMLLSFLSTLQGTGEPTVSSAIPDMRSNTVLVEEVARLEQQLGASVDPDRDRKLAQLETAKAMLDRAKRRQDESDRRETGIAEEIRVDPNQMQPLKSMIPSLVVEVARLKAEIADAIARSEIEMALPRIAATDAQSDLIFIITGGRIYIVPGKQFIDIALDLCTRFRAFDERCVDATKCEVECGGANLIQTIVLNLGSGVDLKDPMWSDSPQWKEWWSWVGPAPVVASVIVDPDSFREFATVRRFFSSVGKRYDIDPKMYSGSYKAIWRNGAPSGQ